MKVFCLDLGTVLARSNLSALGRQARRDETPTSVAATRNLWIAG